MYKNYSNKVMKYFKAHPTYNSVIHVLAGMGLGIVMARPFIDHPVKWGLVLVGLGILGHLYPLMMEK
jgi:hypothetical protein